MLMNSFTSDAARELEETVTTIEAKLRAISDSAAAAPREPGKWSRKQVLGHLIDSAANNHQRFVRLRTAPHIDLPGYEQNAWVEAHGYGEREWNSLVDLWSIFNRNLVEVLRRVPASSLENTWTTSGGEHLTLEWIITDYLKHMRHHTDQILSPI
jgi:hypothetical protein